jgi:hypothetical protein
MNHRYRHAWYDEWIASTDVRRTHTCTGVGGTIHGDGSFEFRAAVWQFDWGWRRCRLQAGLRAYMGRLSSVPVLFFSKYTIHRRHSQRTHTHPYGDCAGKSTRLTKSPQAPRCQRERRLPLKAQTPLNPEKFAPTRSRTQNLRCYRGSCNH